MLLSDKGRTDEALELVEGYLTHHPEAVPERRLAIRLQGAVGNLGAARAHAAALSEKLGARSPVPAVELGHALELGHRYDAALELYDLAAEVAPHDPLGPRTGGLRAAAWGEATLAEPRLAEAARRDGSDPRTWHALGLVRAKLGDLDGAERAYHAGIAASPRDLPNRIGLATVALLRDEPGRVLAEYQAILTLFPDFADAHLGCSWALVRLGRFDEADRAIARAEALGASPESVARQRRWLGQERRKLPSSGRKP